MWSIKTKKCKKPHKQHCFPSGCDQHRANHSGRHYFSAHQDTTDIILLTITLKKTIFQVKYFFKLSAEKSHSTTDNSHHNSTLQNHKRTLLCILLPDLMHVVSQLVPRRLLQQCNNYLVSSTNLRKTLSCFTGHKMSSVFGAWDTFETKRLDISAASLTIIL